jgi:hypothetical protein
MPWDGGVLTGADRSLLSVLSSLGPMKASVLIMTDGIDLQSES